jgi:hypothetical protein
MTKHIWTDSPVREIWQQLRYLRSQANVVNLLSGRTRSARTTHWPDSDDLKRRAYDISSCIEQADQYFHAAQEVGLATKPLLQFYGAQALAKALVIANDDAIKLHDLRYHGLSSRASTATAVNEKKTLQNYSDGLVDWTIEEEFAVTHDGVFPYLAGCAGDRVPARGLVLYFKDLLRITPDLSDLFTLHYGERSHAFYTYGKPQVGSDGHYSVSFSKVDKGTVRSIFPEFDNNYEEIDHRGNPGFLSLKKVDHKPDFGIEVSGTVAGIYFTRPHPCGIVSPLSVLYAAQFILSNVVRYKPAFWMRVLEGRSTGSASIVEALCNLVERRFPCEILGTLWNERFSFGSPGYLV